MFNNYGSQSTPTQAEAYFRASGSKVRCHVPAYERMLQLYAFGNTISQIVEILHNEFSDLDMNPYTPESIRKIIQDNHDEFDAVRRDLGIACRTEIQEQTKRLFEIVQGKECLMVDVFAEKMQDALESLRGLDLDEKDDDGNYKNTSRVFVLTEMVIKLQSSIAKIVGTDALREVEIFRQKALIKKEAEGDAKGSLLPAQPARGGVIEAEVSSATKWI